MNNYIVDLRERNSKIVPISTIALVVLLATAFIGTLIFSEKETPEEIVIEVPQTPLYNPFEALSLEGKAIYVWDAKYDRSLYERNAHEPLALASISKIMTALVAHEVLGDRKITIHYDDLASEGDSGLLEHELWDARDLTDFTLVVSSNDGARALASAFEAGSETPSMSFVDYMNLRAQEIGLRQTSFNNPSGLDADDLSESGAYGSARDVALLVDYILSKDPSILEATQYDTLWIRSDSNIPHIARNTNEIVNNIPFIIASKTGFTDLAGGNLMIAFDIGFNHPIVITVLGSSKSGRFSDIEKLYNATMEYIIKNDIKFDTGTTTLMSS